MELMTTANLQKQLQSKGVYKGQIDGIWGTQSDKALTAFLDSRKHKMTFDWRFANLQRKTTAAWQLICAEAGVSEVGTIDGYMGASTRYAMDILESIILTGKRPALWRDDEAEPQLALTPAKTVWPLQREVEKFYGKIGQNQTLLKPPYQHYFAWQKSQALTTFSIHEKCHDSAMRVLSRVLSHYGPERIAELHLDLWSGCLNPRPMRGSDKPSMHSWGIAIDYDGDNNQLKWGRDRALFAKPDYDIWWRLWEEEGWLSLGRARNYDWMHVQATRLS